MKVNGKLIVAALRRGIPVTPVLPGRRSPKGMPGFRERATTSVTNLRKLAKEFPGHNWCCIAKLGIVCMLDIDDLEAARAAGFVIPENTFIVRSPRGGWHVYFIATPVSDALGNCDVLGCDGRTKIIEFKANNLTCAAPGVYRSDKEPHGWYEPVNDLPLIPIPGETVNWLKKNGTKKNRDDRKVIYADWHPEFDRSDWCDDRELCLTGKEKTVNGVDFLELAICPLVGRAHTGAGEGSFCTCITFGKRIGLSCKGCPGRSIRDLYQMWETEGKEEYPYYVYGWEDEEMVNEQIMGETDFQQPQYLYHYRAAKGDIFSHDGLVWYDGKGERINQ